ncbi:hypothetical protein Syun_020359 [Stephania yunnanensis]|uniref:UDP-N-acetylglucosamine--peptide N-acetylglucosaminyltransferase SPINDLY n=1 Tax=Stephania yunnanensis TaxID=152371 RepID=A0AAP0IE33_9MAGN
MESLKTLNETREDQRPVQIKAEPCVVETSTKSQSVSKVLIADLNVDPPESDGEDLAPPPEPTRVLNDETAGQERNLSTSRETDFPEGEGKKLSKSGKNRPRIKGEYPLEYGPDGDVDQPCQGVLSARDEKVSSLKTGLVHVARKVPKNAHAHFILGLMYQRLGQAQKAVSAYEKAEEILLRSEEEIDRPELLSLVQIHHAQCILLGSLGDSGSNKELAPEELNEIISNLRKSVEVNVRQAAVWNTFGIILLKTGRLENAISVFSSLLEVVSDHLDALANLGIAYLQNDNLDLSTKCFQDLILKDQNHPAALVNYAALLLCGYGSFIAGAGASSGEGVSRDQAVAANVAKDLLSAAASADPKVGHIWVNLADAHTILGDYRSAGKCLEKAAKLAPNCMSTRYALALYRVKDAERFQDPSEQLTWAGNEMASILREGDAAVVDPHIAWTGLAMVHRAQHEISAAYDNGQKDLSEVEDRALYTLKQAIGENPDDAAPWNQLGLHHLCTLQFKESQKYLKAAVARCKESSYTWSNLGISVQLSEDPSQAEEVYRRALSLSSPQHAHCVLSNLGTLYRQQKRYDLAKAVLNKSLELQPGYAPAYNNLGLVFVAEEKWEDARIYFEKALKSDPLLDAANSNMMKAVTLSKVYTAMSASLLQD